MSVGIDPTPQINWITSGPIRPKQLFIDGKVDAFLGFPPEPQELRANGIKLSSRPVFSPMSIRGRTYC